MVRNWRDSTNQVVRAGTRQRARWRARPEDSLGGYASSITNRGMSHESVRADLSARAPDLPIIEVEHSTATVAEAAVALGVTPGQIAKTLALRIHDRAMLLVTSGDTRLDNQKAKLALGGKPRMVDPAETLALTGHPVGGVCPFGLARPLPIYCDVSLRAYPIVFPAAGSLTTSVEIAPDRLATLTDAAWVDVCKPPVHD